MAEDSSDEVGWAAVVLEAICPCSAGLNLEGIRRVMALENENVRLRHELGQARELALHAIREAEKVVPASGGDLVPLKQAVAVFGQHAAIFDRD